MTCAFLSFVLEPEGPVARLRFTPDVADLMKIIDASGLDYRLTAAGTIIEGTWDQLMSVAKNRHGEMRKKTDWVITLMKVGDYGNRSGRLTTAVESVEKKLGKRVKK
jgi:uncharacterized protein YqgV (UPF0045/DUF77 family)